MILAVNIYGQNSYKVYKLQGKAYRGQGKTEQIKNGDIIKASDYLNLTHCQRFALLDNATKKVYYIEDRNISKASQMIAKVKKQSRNTSARILNTAIATLSDNQRSRYSEIGAASRGTNQSYDNDTRYVYMKICQYLTNDSIEYPQDVTYTHKQEADGFYFSITNNSDTDLFVSVLYKSSETNNVYDLLEEDSKCPSLLVPSNSTIDLPHIIIAGIEDTCMLVACDECFSGHDLSIMMNKHIVPLNESDFESIPSRICLFNRVTK